MDGRYPKQESQLPVSPPTTNHQEVLESKNEVPRHNDYYTETGNGVPFDSLQTLQNGSLIKHNLGHYNPIQHNCSNRIRELEAAEFYLNAQNGKLIKHGKKNDRDIEDLRAEMKSINNNTVSKDQHNALVEENKKLTDDCRKLRDQHEAAKVIKDGEVELLKFERAKLETELKDLQGNLEMAVLEKDMLTTSNLQLTQKAVDLEHDLSSSQEKHEAEIKNLNEKLQAKNSQVDELNLEVQRICGARNGMRNEKETLENKVDDFMKENKNQKMKIESLEGKLESKRKENEHLKGKLQRCQLQPRKLATELEREKKKSNGLMLELEREKNKNEFEIQTQRNKNEILQDEKQNLTTKVNDLEIENSHLNTCIQNLEAEKKALTLEQEETISKHSSECRRLQQELDNLETKRAQSKMAIEDLKKRLASENFLNNKDEEMKISSLELESQNKTLLDEKDEIISKLKEKTTEKGEQLKLKDKDIRNLKKDLERMKTEKKKGHREFDMKIGKKEREIKRLQITLHQKEKDKERLDGKVKDLEEKFKLARDEAIIELCRKKEELSKKLEEQIGENINLFNLLEEYINKFEVKNQELKSESHINDLCKDLQLQRQIFKVERMNRTKSNRMSETTRKPIAIHLKRSHDDDDETVSPEPKKFHMDQARVDQQTEIKTGAKLNQLCQEVSTTENIEAELQLEPGEIVDDDE